MKKRIHIMGASGSGTTTISKAVCEKIGYTHFDSDDYFWVPDTEPFTARWPDEKKSALLGEALMSSDQWVLSGWMATWGKVHVPLFELVVFVYVPTDIRVERLRKREYELFGDKVLPGGERHEDVKEFLAWAAAYDTGTEYGRNLGKHEAWLKTVQCPVLRIVNDDLDESVGKVIEAIL